MAKTVFHMADMPKKQIKIYVVIILLMLKNLVAFFDFGL